jgi:hypothetical protein
MAERDFKGVWVPKEIWLDKTLTLLDKAIMVEVDSLDKTEELGCWAGNEHFAEMFDCTPRKVSDSISKLIKRGYIKVIRYDGRKRYLRSCIKVAFPTLNNDFQSDTNKSSSQNDEIFQSDSRNVLQSNSYSKTNNKNTSYSCAERSNEPSTPSEPPVFSLPLNDGSEYGITQTDFNTYKKLYPSVDVMRELRKMYGWLDSNPKKKKTKHGIKRFINGWLSREQDKGGNNDNDKDDTNPGEPWWKSKPWWEWPIEEQRKLEQQVEERERAERERNGG